MKPYHSSLRELHQRRMPSLRKCWPHLPLPFECLFSLSRAQRQELQRFGFDHTTLWPHSSPRARLLVVYKSPALISDQSSSTNPTIPTTTSNNKSTNKQTFQQQQQHISSKKPQPNPAKSIQNEGKYFAGFSLPGFAQFLNLFCPRLHPSPSFWPSVCSWCAYSRSPSSP